MSSDFVLCGYCAFMQGYSKKERIDLAFRLDAFTVYVCSNCHCYLYYNGSRWFKTKDMAFIQRLADCDLKKVLL